MKKLLYTAGLIFLAMQTAAFAQAPRTWVSGTGDDANACSRASACKTFAGAYGKTAIGGVINIIDPGGYGSLTISRSVSIIAERAQAGILSVAAYGIIINAGPNDVVRLEGLSIQSGAASGNGIVIAAAGTVYISNCLISGYQSGAGISLASTSATKVFVSDCDITQNSIGIGAAQATGENLVALDRVRLVGNDTGIASQSESAIFRLSNSVLSLNTVAVGRVNGKILSAQNNAFLANGDDGQGLGKEPLK